MEVADSGDSPRPHGNPVPRTEVGKRLKLIEALMVKHRSSTAVLRAARAELDLPYRTTERYMRRVRLLWESEAKDARPAEREWYRRRLVQTSNKAEKGGRYAASVTALRLLADIDGVRAPEKHEVAVSTDAVDLDAMTPEEFEAYSEHQDAMRQLRAKARARKG